jgi:hypothetical protein
LIDVTLPSNWSKRQKEAEKKVTYKNLSTEIQRMCNMNFFTVPVITGATGTVNQNFKSLKSIPGQQSTDYLQQKPYLEYYTS